MTPRARRFLFASALLAFAAGCAHRPGSVRDNADARAALAAGESEPAREPTRPRVERVTAPGTAFMRNRPDDPFEPRLVVTTQVAHGDLFLHALDRASPRYLSAQTLYRGQRAYLLPFAANYGVAPDRRTDLTFEVRIRRPDGRAGGEPFSAVLWQYAVSGPELLLYPATTVSFHAEAADPLGEYQIDVLVTDHLAGTSRTLTHSLHVIDYAPSDLPEQFDAQAWFSRYYQYPTPELALPALPRLLSELPSDRRASAIPPILGFYDQLLGDNTWLLPAFCARLAVASPEEAYALSLVLGHHLRRSAAPPAGVDFATWTRLADFRTYAWPSDPEGPLERAAQLDNLWGRFLASGLYSPLERLLDPLAHHDDLGAADRWQKLRAAAGAEADLSLDALAEPPAPGDTDAPPDEVRRDVLLRTAIWTLRNHVGQHTLVRSYLDWTLQLGTLPPAERGLLARILRPEPAAPAAAIQR